MSTQRLLRPGPLELLLPLSSLEFTGPHPYSISWVRVGPLRMQTLLSRLQDTKKEGDLRGKMTHLEARMQQYNNT